MFGAVLALLIGQSIRRPTERMRAAADRLALGEKRPPPHAQIKVPLTLRPGESDQPMRLDKSAPVSKRIRKRAPAA